MASKVSALAIFVVSQIAACASSPPPKSGSTDATVAAEATIPAAAPDEDKGDGGPIPVTREDPSWGNPNAPVTLVEFADFQCPFSRKAAATLQTLRARYGADQLRIVWKNNPLPFHNLARTAAEGAYVAFSRGGDQAFWVYYDAVYGNNRPFSEPLYREAMKLAGAPEDSVIAMRPKATAKIDADLELGKKIGVSGTPAFFINGIHLSGAQPVEKFTAVIDEELPKAKALVAQGAFPARVYATRSQANYKTPSDAPSPPSKPEVDDPTVWNVPIGNSPVRGNKAALVTIVEFADYQCPFCGRVEATLAQIQSQYGDKVRIVYKDEPLPFHPRALPASEVAREVRAKKGDASFWKFHDALFADQKNLDDDSLAAAAVQVGLDKGSALAVIKSKRHQAAIDADAELGEDVSATGTPHFFINGRRLVGAQPFEKFSTMIDAELVRAEELVKQGTPPNRVYESIIKSGKAASVPETKSVPAPTAANPSRGPANGKIVVHYFADFQCPFCKRVEPTLDELEKAFPGQVRIVWHNNPLPMHSHANLAAEAAMEAFAQKGSAGFWAFHDVLMNDQTQIERAGLDAAAIKIGLDMRRFAIALDKHTHQGEIDAEKKIAENAGLTGTPAFVINGYFVSGAQPIVKFKKVASYSLSHPVRP